MTDVLSDPSRTNYTLNYITEFSLEMMVSSLKRREVAFIGDGDTIGLRLQH